MIRDVTEFRRAEVACLWVDELETPVGRPAGREASYRPPGRRADLHLPSARVRPPTRTGHRGQRVTVRRRASPPCAAEGVAPDQIPEADRGRHAPPGRTATAAATCAAPGPTRHATGGRA